MMRDAGPTVSSAPIKSATSGKVDWLSRCVIVDAASDETVRFPLKMLYTIPYEAITTTTCSTCARDNDASGISTDLLANDKDGEESSASICVNDAERSRGG